MVIYMEYIIIAEAPERTVKAVTALPDYRLRLTFDNGEVRIYDASPLIRHEAFAPLADEALFRQVHIIFDYTVGWNDAIDICPGCLYERSTPE